MIHGEDRSSGFMAIIPARGGSKGLPGKNLMKVQEISLIARAILIAKKINQIKWIIVSTDDKGIAMEAERFGVPVPFMRPTNLANSDTPLVAVLEHAVKWFRSSIIDFDDLCEGVVLLQPTSPMRKTKHVMGAMELYTQSRLSGMEVAGVHTMSPVAEEYCPWNLWRFKEQSENRIYKIVDGLNHPQLYYRNGVAVVLDPERLGALTLAEKPVLSYIIDEPIVTIDSLYDLLYIEYCGGRLEPDTL